MSESLAAPTAPRLNYQTAAPDIYPAMAGLEVAVRKSGLEQPLLELVKMRASQINGCAFCLDMHSRDARKHGESENRLYLLNAWREAPVYTDRERAALAWTEAVTLVATKHPSQELYEQVRAQFSEAELASLTLAIVAINGWNRLAISFQLTPPAEPA